MKRQFRNVAVGGTFDELHKGHIALLSKAFEVGDYVFVGLTSDEFVTKLNKTHKVALYNERLLELTSFLEKSEFKSRFEISPLYTAYGLTLIREDLEALIVSQETSKIGEIINKKRAKAGLTALSIIEVALVPAENKKPISTTCIRAKEIDKNGHLLKRKPNNY
ncbi:MAG: pantetheine-phosphate adenylyltransferase [Candidatus Bathyarchaeota archaeon]|nr:pantetheine-phosphate adenylyltransferase [Candidatus Termiticorpusculum sp.]